MPYKDPEKRREASRRWRKQNPEKKREEGRRYRAENPEKVRAYQQEWCEQNPEKRREYSRRHYARNPEKRREATRQHRARNPEKMAEKNRQRRERRIQNPEKAREEDRRWREAARRRRGPVKVRKPKQTPRSVVKRLDYRRANVAHGIPRRPARRIAGPTNGTATAAGSARMSGASVIANTGTAEQHAWREQLKDIPSPRKREPWTPADDATVMRDDVTLIELAYMLGRSYGAVKGRRRNLRRERDDTIPAPRDREPWTPAEDAIAMRDDITPIAIAHKLGRSYSSVLHRRSRIKRRLDNAA